jgi:hypothetical protein
MSDPTDDMAVVVVTRGQLCAAAAPIAAGHLDYPSFRFVFPDPRRRANVLPVFFEATVRNAIPYGAVLAATHGDRVDATAVWLPPGGFPWTLPRKLRAAPSLDRIGVEGTRPRIYLHITAQTGFGYRVIEI